MFIIISIIIQNCLRRLSAISLFGEPLTSPHPPGHRRPWVAWKGKIAGKCRVKGLQQVTEPWEKRRHRGMGHLRAQRFQITSRQGSLRPSLSLKFPHHCPAVLPPPWRPEPSASPTSGHRVLQTLRVWGGPRHQPPKQARAQLGTIACHLRQLGQES